MSTTWTGEQVSRIVRATKTEARNAALEEAAKVVEKLSRDEHPEFYAAAIRTLKDKP